MSEPSLRNSGCCSPLLAEQVDETCDRFEVAWKSAAATIERPRIEDYLSAVADPERPGLLSELVHLDVYYRRLHGEDPQPADYDTRFPGLDQDWLAGAVANRATTRPDRALASTPEPFLAPTARPWLPGVRTRR